MVFRTGNRLPDKLTETRCETSRVPSAGALARCLDCAVALEGRGRCLGCGRDYPERDGILAAINPLHGNNRIAAAFYDGPGWARFQFWERMFLRLQGGQRRARRQILRHLPSDPGLRVLEVGIGDGENLALLPRDWAVYGVDIARTRLEACLRRTPAMAGRLVWAEAEALPFDDGTFDACCSIGGFNYFRDHKAALHEMRRVTKAGGTLIVADEDPHLKRFGIGHLLGRPAIDGYWLRGLGLDREFVEMVLACDLDVASLFSRAWPEARRITIWCGLGYAAVDAVSSEGALR